MRGFEFMYHHVVHDGTSIVSGGTLIITITIIIIMLPSFRRCITNPLYGHLDCNQLRCPLQDYNMFSRHGMGQSPPKSKLKSWVGHLMSMTRQDC